MKKWRTPLLIIGIFMVGTFFWMRNLASWRPQRIANLPPKDWISYLSEDGTQCVLFRSVKQGKQSYGQYSTLDLKNGKRQTWGRHNENAWESGRTGNFFWQVVGEPVYPPNYVFHGESGDDEPTPTRYTIDLYDWTKNGQHKKLRWVNEIGNEFRSAVVSRDRKTLYLLSTASLQSWNMSAGKRTRLVKLENLKSRMPQPQAEITNMVLSPDEQLIWESKESMEVTSQGQDMRAYSWAYISTSTGKIQESVHQATQPGSSGSISFSSDGRIVIYRAPIYGNTTDSDYRFYNPHTGKLLWSVHSPHIQGMAFSTDNAQVFVLEENGCEVHDAYSGRLLRHLNAPTSKQVNRNGVLRANKDWIYTQDDKGVIWQWRFG